MLVREGVKRIGTEDSIGEEFDWQCYLDNWIYRLPNRESLESFKILINHVSKTGGWTLNKFCRSLFDTNNVRVVIMPLDKCFNGKITLDFSHRKNLKLPLYFYEALSNKCLYLSMVRYPVDRLISKYKADCRNAQNRVGMSSEASIFPIG
ncbi:MAG: sulfotransferase family 2 domain-containing protein [Rhodospirillales bacterium]|nr:sulfotransferase family 2 domain-containing protein [Rhodospirillales bacterium]